MEIPIWDMLQNYAEKEIDRFHMPGHKGHPGFFGDIGKYDVTETPYTDNLYHDHGVIKMSRTLAATAFGARETFFLVNGATAGIQTMLMSSKAKKVIIAGNVHRSVISGLILKDLEPVMLPYRPGEQTTAEDILKALLANPDSDILLTSPDYYGLCCDLIGICNIAREKNARVFLDCAHGTHFGFSPSLPPSPKDSGVDMWVASAHKTGGSLTQSAYLNVAKSSTADSENIMQWLMLLQTSSPSYLLMASLDYARAGLEEGAGKWEKTIQYCNKFRKKINSQHGLYCYDQQLLNNKGVSALDPTRLTVDVSQRGLTGFEAFRSLMEKGIMAEMADYTGVVFIVTPYDEPEKLIHLENVLEELPAGKGIINYPLIPPMPQRMMSLRQAFFAEKKSIKLEHAIGHIAGTSIGVYPPGIPVLLPGDLITAEIVDYFIQCRQKGAELFGTYTGGVPVVEISSS